MFQLVMMPSRFLETMASPDELDNSREQRRRVLGAHLLDAETQMPRKGERNVGLIQRERVRPIIVGHELADQAASLAQRNEGGGADPLRAHRGLEIVAKIGLLDVSHADRRRIDCVKRPRRVAFDGGPIAIGQAAPGNEPHHARLVGEQDRRTLAVQGAQDRRHRGIIDRRETAGALQLLGQLIERGLLLDATGQLLFGTLAIGDVLLDPHRVR